VNNPGYEYTASRIINARVVLHLRGRNRQECQDWQIGHESGWMGDYGSAFHGDVQAMVKYRKVMAMDQRLNAESND
jgi:hypothetical protein